MKQCDLNDDDLQLLHDNWSVLSDERGLMGTKIIEELLYLRGLFRQASQMYPFNELEQ